MDAGGCPVGSLDLEQVKERGFYFCQTIFDWQKTSAPSFRVRRGLWEPFSRGVQIMVLHGGCPTSTPSFLSYGATVRAGCVRRGEASLLFFDENLAVSVTADEHRDVVLREDFRRRFFH